MFRRWSDETRLKFYFIWGGWLFIGGIITTIVQGPGGLIACVLGAAILVRGFVELARWRRKRL